MQGRTDSGYCAYALDCPGSQAVIFISAPVCLPHAVFHMLEWKSGERCCLRERLRNEAATLAFVAANTTIPVPSCRLYTQNGLLHLETKRITNGVLLEEIDQERRAAAAAAVDHQITSFVLPQLRSLRRGYIGSVDPSIPVFPPQRVYDCDRRPWDRISAAAADALALCHNDIGPQNIFVCPDTFRIVAIIDWEFAGLFPPYFELPLWRVFDWGDEQKLYDEANARELGFFGLKAGDLVDCLPPPS